VRQRPPMLDMTVAGGERHLCVPFGIPYEADMIRTIVSEGLRLLHDKTKGGGRSAASRTETVTVYMGRTGVAAGVGTKAELHVQEAEKVFDSPAQESTPKP